MTRPKQFNISTCNSPALENYLSLQKINYDEDDIRYILRMLKQSINFLNEEYLKENFSEKELYEK